MRASDVPDFAEYAGYSAADDDGGGGGGGGNNNTATADTCNDGPVENGLSDSGVPPPDNNGTLQQRRRRHRRRRRRACNFSDLKSAFRAVFEPSTNRLSMKIYGSEKAVLRERLRQRSSGFWVIHPCSKFRFYWDLCMLLLLVANLIILPVGIAFFNNDIEIRWIIFNCLSDVIFLVDIAVNFRTGILQPDNSEQVVLEPKLIAWNYLRSWFFLDLISSLPLDYLFLLFNQEVGEGIQFLHAGRALRILRLAKLLSLVRLLRLSRLMRYVNQWEEVYISDGSSCQRGHAGKYSSSKFLNMASVFMRIFNLICMMLLIGHWSGCLQFLIPSLQGFPANSWVAINELQEAHWAEQYSWSLFKAMSHILCIGYGRFPPQSISDMWLTMLSMVSGATCYALFLGHATNLIQSLDSSRRQYREKVKQVEEFMSYRRLPLDMRKRITEYFEHRYQGRFFDEKWILNEMSNQLRVEVRNYTCQKLVTNLPIFRSADTNVLTEIIDCLEFEMFQPGDTIVHEGTAATKMYFIHEGVVEVLVASGQEVVATLDDGSFFGETCLWASGRARRPVSVRAETYCNLFSLSAADFNRVVDQHPEFKDYVTAVLEDRAKRMAIVDKHLQQAAEDAKPRS